MKKNIIFSILSTGTNYVLPLLVIPYCISSYGLDGYGIISLTLALTSIVALLTQLNLENTFASLPIAKDGATISNIIIIKFIIYISVVAIIYLLTLMFINENSFLFILGVLPLFFCVTNVNYYFIAQQNFKLIFYLNVLSKLFFTIVVFIVIYLKLPLSLVVMGMNGWYTTSSVVGLFLLRKVIRDSPIKDSEGAINLKEGISLFKIIMPGFSSSLASLFLTMLVQPFMAIVTSNNYSIIAIYSICDKCIRAATGFLDSINNVLYSKISSLEQLIEKKKIVFKAMTFYLLIEFFGLLLLYLLFPYMTSYIEKFRKYQDLLGLVFLITPIIMVITLGNIFSSLILFTSGIFKEVTYTIILSSAIFMTIIFIPYNLKNIEYFLFALLLSEGISTILKGMLVWKKTKFFK
ncbi:hypothetical protein D6T91_19445 [Salmonella enterica subsp. houtenae]|nr:hypothetical protein [Salmonella enterica subsp. houtenae]